MTDQQSTPTARRTRRVWPWAAGGAVALLAGGYVALAVSMGDSTAKDTTVGGVQIGGLSHAQALEKLRTGLQDKAAAAIPVNLGEQRISLDPAAAGLAVDCAGSLDGLTGTTYNPVELINRLTGSVSEPAKLAVDQAKLEAALTSAGEAISTAPKDATLAFKKGVATVTPGVDGSGVDVPATADAVTKGWLQVPQITGAVKTVEPDVTTDEATKVKTDVADTILAGPVTVKAGEKSFEVAGADIADSVTFTPTGGTLAAAYDEKTLVGAVRKAGLAAKVLQKGRDAVVTSSEGSFKVAPSIDGLDVDAAKVPAAIEAAITSSDRTADVPVVAAPATFTTAEAKATLPTGVISTFTTQFPYNPDRTHNITLAASKLNGVYVAPGEQFSLNGLLGKRTPEKGYRGAPVIYNGRLTTDYGGGISQVSTTLFNAVFFSGAQIDEFHPHSFYISRYPEGREATISWPDVDQKFTNTTKGGILITTKVDANSITVTFQGKKTWDVTAWKGPRTAVVEPKTIHDTKEGCVPQSPSEGFNVTVGRVFKSGSKVVKESTFTTHYIPEDLVICG